MSEQASTSDVAEEDAEYVIENPATGERIRFFEEPTPTGGDVLRFEFWARPHIVGPAAHVHPKQTEYFEVRNGVLSARVGDEDYTLATGESMTVPMGTAHTWWNGGDEELHGYVELRPSMNIRDEFEALFALGRAGKTDETGLPNLLQIAVLLDTYPDTIYRAGIPVPLQKAGIRLLAPIARQLGYKARYPELVGADASEVA
jgi:mannose-6-phosphate isomerase-like protein (cupin superfamily)